KKYNNFYQWPASKEELVPFAMQTTGGFCTTARDYVRRLAKDTPGTGTHAHYAVRVKHVMEQLSVSLWSGNARMILRWQAEAFKAPAAGGNGAVGLPVPVVGAQGLASGASG